MRDNHRKRKSEPFDPLAYIERLTAGDHSLNPFLEFMGMSLEWLDKGKARFRMPIRPGFFQAAGVVQGGLLVAMASETIAHAAATLLVPGEKIVTFELKNNFLAAAVSGDLIADASILHRGDRVIVGDCFVSDTEGKALSRTTSSLLRIGTCLQRQDQRI